MRRKADSTGRRPRLGLALSGGAARGLAHVGVLKVFAEHGVRVDRVAGTSAGALVGGALAAGMSAEEIEKIGRSLRWRDLGRMTVSRLGVQSNAVLEKYVRERFPVSRFEELPTPFAAVATDLRTGAAVVMRDEGDLGFAVRASCAIPGWYVPVTDAKGRQLVDGGLVANLPVSVARALGAEVVVAVDVNSEGAKFLGPPASVLGVLLQFDARRPARRRRAPAATRRRRSQSGRRTPPLGRIDARRRTHRRRRRGRTRRHARHQRTARTPARRRARLVQLPTTARAPARQRLKSSPSDSFQNAKHNCRTAACVPKAGEPACAPPAANA